MRCRGRLAGSLFFLKRHPLLKIELGGGAHAARLLLLASLHQFHTREIQSCRSERVSHQAHASLKLTADKTTFISVAPESVATVKAAQPRTELEPVFISLSE
jgi:hypothetical protein